ncbi:MAG: lauroyl acyltransferase [Rhodobacterales bacterium 65-51]|uniref:lysophospholipid acyltransferase family protein n=1 Tax=uncultured Gemmobacter sp. TaxID=1095917 RepID=UPI00095F93F8|nr:lauroyl acyltransferase [uncultured Gemmobacter sp.]OJY27449.1 MAG: lauroyl acyltransferase [Rhodobacterales bacterium 65-51]
MKPSEKLRFRLDHWLQNLVLRGLIGTLLTLPYRWRVPLCGWIFARVIAPLAGYDRRIRDNLARIFPDMPEPEVRRMLRAVPDNVGRTVIELYSGAPFIERALAAPMHGPGLAALEEARAANRPVVLVTGHFGNYDASRAALIARGFRVGGLYRPMTNRYFNAHYVAAISRIGTPLFARGRQGMAGMIRFLREGGILGIVQDQHMNLGVKLKFFGHDAMTALSAAELALKYDALVVPTYAIRQENGLDFDILVDAPIPHTTAEQMTQALNDHLEAHVRDHLDQWFWIHKRWKV